MRVMQLSICILHEILAMLRVVPMLLQVEAVAVLL